MMTEQRAVKFRLTPEEKRAAKAKKKLQKKLVAEEKKRQSYRDYLKREVDFTKKSRDILDKHWDEICGNIAKKDMIVQMNCTRQNLMRILDDKDRKIETLLQDIAEAEVQYKRRLEGHIGVLEYLMKIYKYFTGTMKETYDSDCLDMVVEFNDEAAERDKYLKENVDYYEKYRHAENAAMKEDYATREDQFIRSKILVVACASDKRDTVKEKIDENIKKIKNKMKEIVLGYQKQVPIEMLERYERMATNVGCALFRFQKMEKEARKLEEDQMILQSQLTDVELSFNHKIQILRNERLDIEKTYWAEKNTLKMILLGDKHNLGALARMSNNAIKALEVRSKVGENLMKISNICLKYERDSEKLIEANRKVKKLWDDEELVELTRSDPLEIFYAKISCVEYRRNLLRAEKEELELENQQLTCMLREYCVRQKVQMNVNWLMFGKGQSVGRTVQEGSVIPQIKARLNWCKK